jgi:hypothetical protein
MGIPTIPGPTTAIFFTFQSAISLPFHVSGMQWFSFGCN